MRTFSEPGTRFSLEIDDLRQTYCEPVAGCPEGVISRKIWLSLARFRGGVQKEDEKDIHQTTYAAVLENLNKIVTRFVASGRDPSQRNFEAWLTTCINHLVVDGLRRQPRHAVSIEESEGFHWPAPETDPQRQMQMHVLFSTACESLTPLERDLIEKRLADRQKPASLAAEHGLSPRQVHKLLYETKLRTGGKPLIPRSNRLMKTAPSGSPSTPPRCARCLSRRGPNATPCAQLAAQNDRLRHLIRRSARSSGCSHHCIIAAIGGQYEVEAGRIALFSHV